jgi:hypothetical protein
LPNCTFPRFSLWKARLISHNEQTQAAEESPGWLDHHIFEHDAVPEIVNFQNYKSKAKPYQIRQFLELVEQHNLELGEEE